METCHRKLFLVLFCFSLSAASFCETTQTVSVNPNALDVSSSKTISLVKEIQSAFAILQKSTVFPISGYVGYAAETPQEITAFQTIMKTKHADALFKKLLAQKEISPKLIGLCGVYFTDPRVFIKEGMKLRGSYEKVQTQIGCIVIEVPVAEVLGPIDKIKTDEKGKLHPASATTATTESMVRDIATGELPLLFKNFDRRTTQTAVHSRTN